MALSRTQPFLEWARWGYALVPRSKPTPIAPIRKGLEVTLSDRVLVYLRPKPENLA
jgi:hypothetical protein